MYVFMINLLCFEHLCMIVLTLQNKLNMLQSYAAPVLLNTPDQIDSVDKLLLMLHHARYIYMYIQSM